MSSFSFSKYSGCGNDFILFDHRSSYISQEMVSKLCHRQNGVGADGVILVERSDVCDAKMRIFNADGSEAEMCGNGLRCLAKFLQELGFPKKRLTIETMTQTLEVDYIDDHILATMGTPHSLKQNIDLAIEGEKFITHYIDTGVPHAVIFVDELENVAVTPIGRKIRHHPQFAPKGANANFVKVVSPNAISIRTYERGVEEETFACGTGATASALIAALNYNLKPPIKVNTRSKEYLEIDFKIDHAGVIKNVSQTGPARKKFSGTLDLKEFI